MHEKALCEVTTAECMLSSPHDLCIHRCDYNNYYSTVNYKQLRINVSLSTVMVNHAIVLNQVLQ